MLKPVFPLLIVFLSMIACSVASNPIMPGSSPYEMTHDAQTAYWQTQGVTPTPDSFALTTTRIIQASTETQLAIETETGNAQNVRPTNTPDSFAMTATRLIFDATASGELFTPYNSPLILTARSLQDGDYDTPSAIDLTATQTVRDTTAISSATALQQSRNEYNVASTATAQYWATVDITITPEPDAFSQIRLSESQTQVAAFANGCEYRYDVYRRQFRIFTFYENTFIVNESDDRIGQTYYYECPDVSDMPYQPYDFNVEIIVPDYAPESVIFSHISEAIITLPDYPFDDDTTLGTDNVYLHVTSPVYYSQVMYVMYFTYSELVTALDEGLEGDALLEALGGVESTLP